jgi:Ni,Fe-hydrogenase I cytochrome b subunit
MKVQSYKHHSRYVPLFHFVTSAILILCLAGSAWNLDKAYQQHSGRLVAAIIFGLSYSGLMLFWYARAFAVGAQDRAILAQENLRYFALTGKLLDKRLRKSQVIALRFADDTEFLLLAEKAANENMKSNDIKQAIVNWRADHHRI